MIVTEFVNLKVNINNIEHLKERGYQDLKIKQVIEVKVEDLSKGSHVKITVKCGVCGKIRENLMYKEYLRNLKSGNYYSCKGKCSSDKNRMTNMEKYGVEHYSKTIESKNKIKETSLLKYGVENYMQTEKCIGKIKNTMLERYGVENASNLEFFKQKRKKTMIERYGVDYYVLHHDFLDKSKETSVKNYGVDHPMKLKSVVRERLNKQGLDFETDEFRIYRSKVDYLTRKNKNQLLDSWDGFDFYDGEYIRGNFSLVGQHGDYPTIDHKKSVKECFLEGILPIYVASFDNLCFTKRRINSKKKDNSLFNWTAVSRPNVLPISANVDSK